MKLKLSIPTMLFIGILGPNALAAADSELMAAYDEECRSYAKEDDVPENEMAAYIKQCIEDLSKPQVEEEQTESNDRN